MLQALSSTPAAVTPNIMTLGLERKLATSSGYNSKTSDCSSKEAFTMASPSKPKTILTCKGSELNTSNLSIAHSVQLLLTSYHEILVLKKPGDKSHTQSVLRRHSIDKDLIREHPILPNAVVFEVPGTVLKYIYQFDKSKTLKQLLEKIGECKAEVQSEEDSSAVSSCYRNGFTDRPKAFSSSTQSQSLTCPTLKHSVPATKYVCEKQPSYEKADSRQHLSYSYGPASPVLPQRSSKDLAFSSNCMTSSFIAITTSSSYSSCTYSSSSPASSVPEVEIVGGDLVGGEKTLQVYPSSLESSGYQLAAPIPQIMDGDVISMDNSLSEAAWASPSSNTCTSRNNSPSSSNNSLTTESTQSLNLNGLGMEPTGLSQDRVFLGATDYRKSNLVQRASDQFMGLLKMRSLREKESKKLVYMVKTSSSTSELDLLVANNEEEEEGKLSIGKQRLQSLGARPTSPSVTPTSPLASHAISPTLSLNSGSDNGEEFVVSRFHHTQIRNSKWKQSPRIQRNATVQGGGVTEERRRDKFDRSLSESPTATARYSLGQMELINDISGEPFSDRTALRGYSVPPTQSSTIPRTRNGKKGRRRLVSETTSDKGHTTPNSPVQTPKLVGSKSPKILRIFHKRQSSAAFLKIPDACDVNHSLVDSELSFNLDHTPKEHSPKKLHQFPAKDVAMELTLMDSELLRGIRPEELKDGAWIKKETKEENAPNVLKMIRSFNQLALLVPTEILSETTPQARAKVISAFIQIAKSCYSLHNYNSLKAVLAGLQCTPIYRLNRTWKEVPTKRKKQFNQLCSLMSECENWQLYRSEIQRLTGSNTPFVPFLGMFLTQVVQNESFSQLKQAVRLRDNDNKFSESYSENTPSTRCHLETSHLKKTRRRSASLGDSSPLSVSIVVSPLSNRGPSQSDDTFEHMAQDETRLSADSLTGDVPLTNDGANKVGASRDKCVFNSPSHTQSATPIPGQATPTVIKIEIFEKDGDEVMCPVLTDSCHGKLGGTEETDSGVVMERSSCTTGENRNTDENGLNTKVRDPAVEGEELNLEDISFGFKRRSLSFESLLESYKEDKGLHQVLHSSLARIAKMSVSLQSLDDSEFSDQDHWERDLDESSFLDSFSTSDMDSSSLSCSFNTSSLSKDQSATSTGYNRDTVPVRPHLLKSCSVEEKRVHDTMAANSSKTEASLQLKFPVPQLENCPIDTDMEVCYEPSQHSSSKESAFPEVTPEKIVKRLKNEDKRRLSTPVVNAVTYLLRKPKQDPPTANEEVELHPPTVTPTPIDMLVQFQIASMGCVLGVESRERVRAVVKESQTNSEEDNYKISQERETE